MMAFHGFPHQAILPLASQNFRTTAIFSCFPSGMPNIQTPLFGMQMMVILFPKDHQYG
ncbi:hypothetical protein BVRB_4g071950 [Beta vulgaris subsp. vulgaris]|nr:hypothetical protein BVRB_4g071950 [Beta vulgaris subsp. vulgaris]